MVQIDNKKMWESILSFKCVVKTDDVKNNPAGIAIKCIGDAIKHALKEQGLQFKDGKIVSADPEQEAAKLTEFEKKIQLYGYYTDEKAKEIAKELLAIARKQIAGELEKYKSEAPLGMIPDGWFVGVNDCISNIKEG